MFSLQDQRKHKISVGQIIRMFAGVGRSVTHTLLEKEN